MGYCLTPGMWSSHISYIMIFGNSTCKQTNYGDIQQPCSKCGITVRNWMFSKIQSWDLRLTCAKLLSLFKLYLSLIMFNYVYHKTEWHTLTLSLWLCRGRLPDSVCWAGRGILLWVCFQCRGDLAASFGFMSQSGSWPAECVGAQCFPLQNQWDWYTLYWFFFFIICSCFYSTCELLKSE